jgi:hypothetical protein
MYGAFEKAFLDFLCEKAFAPDIRKWGIQDAISLGFYDYQFAVDFGMDSLEFRGDIARLP